MIIRSGKGYQLKSRRTGRNLGHFRSRKQAMKRERQIQYFKHLKEAFVQMVEAARKPGIMSTKGERLERRFKRELQGYFRALGRQLDKLQLERVAAAAPENLEHALATSEFIIKQAIRLVDPVLVDIFAHYIKQGLMQSDSQHVMFEADQKPTFQDKVGLSAEDAADIALTQAAESVKGINERTLDRLQSVISDAIVEQKGVQALAREIRTEISTMTLKRAETIASTELNAAFSKAALKKMERLGIEYKQIILSPGACPTCRSIHSGGPIPFDEPFVDDEGNEYDSTPIHPNCRCATVGARNPNEEEDQ